MKKVTLTLDPDLLDVVVRAVQARKHHYIRRQRGPRTSGARVANQRAIDQLDAFTSLVREATGGDA